MGMNYQQNDLLQFFSAEKDHCMQTEHSMSELEASKFHPKDKHLSQALSRVVTVVIKTCHVLMLNRR